MKKFLLILLALIMCFSLCACGNAVDEISASNGLSFESSNIESASEVSEAEISEAETSEAEISEAETSETEVSEPEIINPEKCQHNYVIIKTTEPTCTERGKNTFKCDICGDSYSERIAEIGHNWELGNCTICGKELPWTVEHVDKNTIIAKRGNETKVITVALSHLPEEYDDGNSKLTIGVTRCAMYGYGQWIYYIEQVSETTSSGYTGGRTHYQRVVKTSFDGTETIKLNKCNVETLSVLDLIGIENGYLYYFLTEGWEVIGEPETKYLYKIKLNDNISDLIKEGTLISKVDIVGKDWYYKSYIKDGTIYYCDVDEEWQMMDLSGKNK